MKYRLLVASLISLLGSGCGQIFYKTIEATDHMITVSQVRPEVVRAQLADPFGTPFKGAYQNAPKTLVAQQREKFYGEVSSSYQHPSASGSIPTSAKTVTLRDDAASYIRAKWIRWGWIDGAPDPGVAYEIQELSFEERKVILTELCKLYELDTYLTDCPSIYEAQCRVESGCTQVSYNPETVADARDHMGGSGCWFAIRPKVHNVSWDMACDFRQAAEWTIRYALASGLKDPPKDGQSWEDARKQNLLKALWHHNGATSPEAQQKYLDSFNTRLIQINGQYLQN